VISPRRRGHYLHDTQ